MSKYRDPLFEAIAVFAVLLGITFATASTAETVQFKPDPKPTVAKSSYVVPTGDPETLVTGLKAPWEIVFLPDGQALVDERDTGTILQIGTDLSVTKVAFTRTTPPCEKFCEGGTLGMTVAADRPEQKLSLFVFLTTNSDNRILKYDLDKVDKNWQLSNKRVLVKGIDQIGRASCRERV